MYTSTRLQLARQSVSPTRSARAHSSFHRGSRVGLGALSVSHATRRQVSLRLSEEQEYSHEPTLSRLTLVAAKNGHFPWSG